MSTSKPNHSRRWLAVMIATALLAMPWWIPDRTGDRQLRFGFSVWPGVEAAVMSREPSGASAGKMRLMEAQWSSAVTRAFDNDMIDVAALGLDGVLRLRDRGEQLRVVRVLDVSQEADAILAGRGVESMAALRYKRVGVDMAGTGGALLAACVKHEGMALSDLNTVQMVQSEMADALQVGSVDAVVVSEPWLTLLRQEDFHVVSDASRIGLPIARVLVARQAATEEHHRELAALVSVWDRPLPDPNQSDWAPVLRREGLSAVQYQECLKRVVALDRTANREWLSGDSPKLKALAQQWEVVLRGAGIISSRALPHDIWIDDQFVNTEVAQ